MNITISKASNHDIQTLVDMRIRFALELSGIKPEEDIKKLKQQLFNYFSKATLNNICISFIATSEGQAVGIGSMQVREAPGNFRNPSGKWGYLMNMYTLPEYRRKGICQRILTLLMEEGKKVGITAFELHATQSGEIVYQQHGFKLTKDLSMRKFLSESAQL